MAINNYGKNLSALRKSHNLTTDQAAVVAGIDKATYEKMELGFEEVSYEVISKLAGFYNVEVSYFTEEHEVKAPAKAEVVVKENPAQEPKTTAVAGDVKVGKAFRILGLVFGSLVFLCFLVAPVVSVYGYTFFWWNMISVTTEGSSIGEIAAITLLLYALTTLTFSIIHISSKKIYGGKFGLISSIISLSLGSLALILEIVVIAEGLHLAILTALITIADIVFLILKLVEHKKFKKQK